MDQVQQISKACLNCPRCNSTNTKFCYYNNYSLSQPRHFCKACKRYWTRGGTLRNVPVGGGCRKNGKRVKSGRSTLSSILVDAPLSSPNQVSQIPTSTIPATIQEASNDVLTPLLFASYKDMMIHQQQPSCDIYSNTNNVNTNLDLPTDAAFFSSFNNPVIECRSLQNVTPPSFISRNRPDELQESLFPFQTIHQQQQFTIIKAANVYHHNMVDQQQNAQRWSNNNDPQMYTSTPWRR